MRVTVAPHTLIILGIVTFFFILSVGCAVLSPCGIILLVLVGE